MLSQLFRKHTDPPTAPPAAEAPAVSAVAPRPSDELPVMEASESADPAAWTGERGETLHDLVTAHGAVRIHGLGLHNVTDVQAVLHRLTDHPVTEREAFAARDRYMQGVYSSSAWPANQPMCMHHELSYTTQCPSLLLFACLSPPTVGGATATADATAVLRALPTDLVDRFQQEGWLLTRTYNNEIGATLSDSFGTDDHDAVEAYCRANAVDWSWQPDGSLRTRQHRSAVVRHPVSGRPCWFNQIAFLNEWTMAPDVREFLVEEYGPDDLPFNTRYGNGDPVPPDVVEQINNTYREHTVSAPWQAGDLMIVDNIRTAHSREAYEGPRNVVVAMADAVLPDRLAPPIRRAAA
ncbi:TauD/TfdA family dioxygenase [Streptomyces fuscigenes]|uniref:TauD/TfdA family dioxygenase n=1 Tax=Streptomyces fuscigenes TaxID=1528880 RepID=UPI001F40477B|nr:TauD/TfdA family dioxygenase [Streptomyces fuscigenes]MCF3960207.1 TauD/TfdA family dioxygenase [Streptomyces fuscigenes]